MFQAVLDRMADGSLTAKCLGLIADSEKRGCVEKAKREGVPVRVVEKKKGESREEYDKRLHKEIIFLQHQPFDGSRRPACHGAPHHDTKGWQDDVCIACMGWMHIFSPWFVKQFPNRILNVHPALLPKYGGKGMYGIKVHQEVIKNHEQESGMTIHIVTKEVDQGPILFQKKCPVLPDDTPDILQKRVQELEKELSPKVLQMLASSPQTPSP